MREMMKTLYLFLVLLFVSSLAYGGGVDPREMPAPVPADKEKVSATPAQTSAAVSKARKVVAPEVKEERVVAPQPKTVVTPKTAVTPQAVTRTPAVKSSGSDTWMVGTANSSCSPLSSIDSKINVGSFKTPQELAMKMRQRGYQAFVLDIGDNPDQLIRIKVPDRQLDLTFVRSGLCR